MEPLIIAWGRLHAWWHVHIVACFMTGDHVAKWSHSHDLRCSCCQRTFYRPRWMREPVSENLFKGFL
jgi:hypothetical protein